MAVQITIANGRAVLRLPNQGTGLHTWGHCVGTLPCTAFVVLPNAAGVEEDLPLVDVPVAPESLDNSALHLTRPPLTLQPGKGMPMR